MHLSKVSMVSQPCTGKRLGTCHGPTWSNTVQRSDSVLWHVHWFAFFSCFFFSFQLGWTLVIDPETEAAATPFWEVISTTIQVVRRSWDIKTTSNSPKPTQFLPWTSAPLRMLCCPETANSWLPNLRFGTSKVSNPRTSAVSWPRLRVAAKISGRFEISLWDAMGTSWKAMYWWWMNSAS